MISRLFLGPFSGEPIVEISMRKEELERIVSTMGASKNVVAQVEYVELKRILEEDCHDDSGNYHIRTGATAGSGNAAPYADSP